MSRAIAFVLVLLVVGCQYQTYCRPRPGAPLPPPQFVASATEPVCAPIELGSVPSLHPEDCGWEFSLKPEAISVLEIVASIAKMFAGASGDAH